MVTPKKTYTTAEIAEITGVNRRTIQHWARTKRLVAEKQLGRGRGTFVVSSAELKRLQRLLAKHGRSRVLQALGAAALALLLPFGSNAQTFDAAEQRLDRIEQRLEAVEKMATPTPTPPPEPTPPVEPTPPPVEPPQPVVGGVEVKGKELWLAGKRWYMDGANAVAPWGTAGLPEYGTQEHKELKKKLLPKIAALGSKAARLVMYSDARFPSQATYEWRSGLVQAAIDSGQIPIVGLWDDTCSRGGAAAQSNVEKFWLEGDGARLAKQFPQLVVNFFNERNFDPAAGRHERWRDYYNGLVAKFRSKVGGNAIMIDAGGQCAQNPEGIILHGAAMQAADPQHRLIFAVHLYAFWVDSAAQRWPEGQWQISATMERLGRLTVPVVAAEFGNPNNQDGNAYAVSGLLAAVKANQLAGALVWMDHDNASKMFYSMCTTLLCHTLTPLGQTMSAWLKAGR